MIITCLNCASRLQLDDTKVPSRSFTVRCPKCNQIIDVQPAGPNDGSALNGNDLPASAPTHRERAADPPTFMVAAAADEEPSSKTVTPTVGVDPAEAARLLAMLLGQSRAPERLNSNYVPRGTEPRRALVCVAAEHAQRITSALQESDSDMFVYTAEDTTRAIERIREDPMSIIVLDPEFDPVEQGAAFVKREISSLRPAERRRIFFVQLSANPRTADPHNAFINSVNLILNAADTEQLPSVLKRAMRDFNELYRDFNKALNVAPL